MALSLAACGSGETSQGENEKEKITFVLDWTPNTNHTGLYVAQEKGYFEDEGLEVEIVQPPEDGADALVASGKAQFGISFQDTMAPGVVGEDALPTTAVAAVVQHNTSGIISRKGEGMDTPKGLEGKKYATWDAPIEKAMMENVVEADGGDFSKVELIPSTVTDEVSALESKSVDAIWIFYAWAGVATEVAGLETDYFAFKDINPAFDYYTPVIIGNNEFLEKEPETAKKFLSAVKKGYEDAIEDPDGAAEILCEAAPELDQELVKASQEYLKDEYIADADRWGYIDPDRWNLFYGGKMADLVVSGVTKSFDGRTIIEDISIEIHDRELVSLLGVSGGGKTTLFNVISGLMKPDRGQVFLDGEEITGKPGNVSYMLQKDLLLPYRTVEDNVALPLVIGGMKKKEARKKSAPYFEEFGLAGTEKKYPAQLSGGMRQRAALLRTYLFSDRLALLDEPFSALDTLTKRSMHRWYLDVMEQIHLSTVFITHDIDEAVLLSDRIYILGGKPGHIIDEIRIEEPKPRRNDFQLTEEFLSYKKRILEKIEESEE